MFDLRRLGHLVALAEERHFARAAARVHLSQPAFSRSVQALERATGQRLFDRANREIRLTPAGRFLLERARRILFEARSLDRDVKLYGDVLLGDTAFGAGPIPAAALIPRVLADIRRLHPQAALLVQVGNSRQLLERLHAEQIEFYVADVSDLAHTSTLDVQLLPRLTGGLYVRAGHPLSGRVRSLAEVWRYGIAIAHPSTRINSAFSSRLRLPAGRDPAFAVECDDLCLLSEVTRSTDTVMVSVELAVRTDIQSGRLVPLHVRGFPELYSKVGLVSVRGRSLSPMAKRAMALIAEHGRRLTSTSPGTARIRRKSRR